MEVKYYKTSSQNSIKALHSTFHTTEDFYDYKSIDIILLITLPNHTTIVFNASQ
jgi:hypothetical protein